MACWMYVNYLMNDWRLSDDYLLIISWSCVRYPQNIGWLFVYVSTHFRVGTFIGEVRLSASALFNSVIEWSIHWMDSNYEFPKIYIRWCADNHQIFMRRWSDTVHTVIILWTFHHQFIFRLSSHDQQMIITWSYDNQ